MAKFWNSMSGVIRKLYNNLLGAKSQPSLTSERDKHSNANAI